MSNFLEFIEKNPKIYFYDKAVKQTLKHIRENYKLKTNDLEAMSFFEIYGIDLNSITKKLEFVLIIHYGLKKSISYNLYTFMLNDKLHFLAAYGDKDDVDFDLYNFCNAWRIKESKLENFNHKK
ncbi:MAG: hypothetical protein FWC41_07930 [Firmicutes bacterium]|nr:hypothetical protein [Bacillota bacterium]